MVFYQITFYRNEDKPNERAVVFELNYRPNTDCHFGAMCEIISYIHDAYDATFVIVERHETPQGA